MKGIIYHFMTVGVLVCTLGTTFAQDIMTMKVLETNSTDDKFCFYVHANTTEKADISLLADQQPNDADTQGAIIVECSNDNVCRTKICYDRPAFEPVETTIECRAISPTFSIGDGCTVIIYPRGYRTSEPIELAIIADCGFGSPCNLANLNPSDITHLTLGVPRDDGGFDYIAHAGVYASVDWFNEDRELIHSGAWTAKVNEAAYVQFKHYQPYGPVMSGFGNTLGNAGVSFRVSTYTNSAKPEAAMTLSNYPNPFYGQTKIQFTLEKDSPVTLTVHNAMGKKVASVLSQALKPRGEHEIIFNANHFPSGIYYYTIEAGSYTGTQRMNVVK